jgi:hypothetical protein
MRNPVQTASDARVKKGLVPPPAPRCPASREPRPVHAVQTGLWLLWLLLLSGHASPAQQEPSVAMHPGEPVPLHPPSCSPALTTPQPARVRKLLGLLRIPPRRC